MPRDSRQARLPVDFAAPPFDSAPRLLARSTVFLFRNLPFLAALTLAVMIPGNLAVQFACYALDVPPEGILSYFFLELGDLIFGAFAAGAVIYAVVAMLRDGRTPSFADSLRWGGRQWGRMLWNQLKVEITVGLWMLLLFVPGILAAVRLFLVAPVVAIEADAAREPLRRSEELTRGIRWRLLGAALPLMLIDLVGSYLVLDALPGVAHSRWLLALSDSALAVIGQWTTVAAVLIYVARVGQALPPAATKPAPTASRARGNRG